MKWIRSSPKLPPYSDLVPPEEGFSFYKNIVFNFETLKTLAGLQISQFLHFFTFSIKQFADGKFVLKPRPDFGIVDIFKSLDDWDNYGSFNDFFKPWTFLNKPDVANHWDKDTEFGRQRLVGINPTHIRRCTPDNFTDFFKGAYPQEIMLAGGISLVSALQHKQLYFLDYRILQEALKSDIQDELGRYSLGPMCILHHNEAGELLPVAIRLTCSSGSPIHSGDPIFTPASSADDWMSAKIAVASADTAYQGVVTHLLFTHLIMEPFAVSTFRNLPREHILSQMLKPHFFNTLAINDLARVVFLGRGRFFDRVGALADVGSIELLSRAYSGSGTGEYNTNPWQFYQSALPYDLEKRDVNDLSNYYYRDDALLLWGAIEKYVEQLLRVYYPNPDSLIKDTALQQWKDELVLPQCGDIKGLLPSNKAEQLSGRLTNVEDLIAIVTNIIFTATVQHAAVNFGQRDYYLWIPNAQFALYCPYSDMQSDDTQRKFSPLERLPKRSQSILQIVLSSVLSLAPPVSSKTLLTMKNPFTGESARQVFEQFQKQLKEVEQEICSRNQSRNKPYVYLLPSKIPQSVAI